ncbi:TPA: hypothetical protein N0F65_011890 [Lagenidium giganteum]|uniref:non-specific serine/threonine protein kinase n=1 Tax=Lagenidium giganteum TaxID=4803 RepID=A0AAV2YIS5_9STRA|nr:TPA: hypothetical protein N0F65_011890 [Lagenidium giganteum]
MPQPAMMMTSFSFEDTVAATAPASAALLAMQLSGSKTVHVRMRDLAGSVATELGPSTKQVRDIIVRFHELAFSKSYAAYVDQSSLLRISTNPMTGAPQEVIVTSVHELRDAEVLVYKPCEELRSLVERGCITPILCARTRTTSTSSSPCLKRKGRSSVGSASDHSHLYGPILEKMDMSPREKELIEEMIIGGDEQAVDALEQFSITRNSSGVKRMLRGPTKKLSALEHLSHNFATLDVHSAPSPVVPDQEMNPFMNSFVSVAQDPFLMPTMPSVPTNNSSSKARPSLMFDDAPSSTSSAPVFLHSIKENKTPPSRMSLSLDDLDSSFDENAPQFMSIAALLDNVPVGSNFKQAYTMGKVLGSGKYSVVKECVQKSTGTHYAVKVIDKHQMMEVRFLKRELEIMYSLRHQGIVQLIELFESPEELYLVLELCKQELFEYIDREGPLDEATARRLIRTLVSTVAYLHDEAIVHRDIKPENILIYGADVSQIKLTDFGIARKLEGNGSCAFTPHETLTEVATLVEQAMDAGGVRNRLARAHTKCGTRDYVAPEVMSGKGYGTEADMWSVGVVTYVLLSGCAPVFLPTADGTRKVFFSEDCWSEVSDDLKRFIEALLVRNPEERITAVDALAHPWLQ